MTETSRPLSPHLQIYRWQISNTLSIIHRLTGVALSLGAVALVGWLMALSAGQSAFQQAGVLFTSLPGQLLLIFWTATFFYHLCNGIRHLAWDAGYGFDKQVAVRSGVVVVAATVLMTAAFWAIALTRGME